MTTVQPLSPTLTRDVLAHLGVQTAPPDLSLLDSLVEAYTCTVPWESAFRIVKRARTSEIADCPRWPDEFWQDAIQHGAGGTCFESNYAFFSLLRALGYDGYLTINDMGDHIGCHTAMVLILENRHWLADVGLPLYAPLPLNPDSLTERDSRFHNYTIRPDGERRYQIERSDHPKPNCFTLIDRPVPDNHYHAATSKDYGERGLFLDAVIINKVIEGCIWRFSSRESPWLLESFRDGQHVSHPLGGDPAASIAERFAMDVETVRLALATVAAR